MNRWGFRKRGNDVRHNFEYVKKMFRINLGITKTNANRLPTYFIRFDVNLV